MPLYLEIGDIYLAHLTFIIAVIAQRKAQLLVYPSEQAIHRGGRMPVSATNAAALLPRQLAAAGPSADVAITATTEQQSWPYFWS